MSEQLEFRDPIDLDAEKAATDRQAEKARLNREIEISDFKWLMGHKQGRRIVWRWLEQAGVYRTSFNSDPLEMARLEGQRNVGLKLMLDVHQLTPDLYIELLTERTDGNRTDSTGSSTSTSD